MSTHKHRKQAGMGKVRSWQGCVAAGPCSGKAHGAYVFVDYCKCGAYRRTEVNGVHEVKGPWLPAAQAERA